MKFWLRILLGAIVVVGIAIGGLSYAYLDQTVQIGSTAINYVRYWSAPVGTLKRKSPRPQRRRSHQPRRLRERLRLLPAELRETGQATTRRSLRTVSRS